MADRKEILSYLAEGGRSYVADVRIRASDGSILIYVPRELIADKVGRGMTSLRQLNNLVKHLNERYSSKVVVVLTESDSHRELETSLKLMLNQRFRDRIESLFLSSRGDEIVDCWIELDALPGQLENEVAQYLAELLGTLDLAIGEIFWLSSPSTMPSVLALLRQVKAHQPISAQELAAKFEAESGVSEQKIAHAMDSLRRKGLVLWQRPGLYSLTVEGLAAVPRGLSRSSSDIARALALGRRKW